jgi:hypothetical protein
MGTDVSAFSPSSRFWEQTSHDLDDTVAAVISEMLALPTGMFQKRNSLTGSDNTVPNVDDCRA